MAFDRLSVLAIRIHVTDQAANFANILDARSLELTFEHLDELWDRFVQPDTWAILPNLLYWLVLIVISLAKAAALGAITYGMIATAVRLTTAVAAR